MRFLDRFVYKNPKKQITKHGMCVHEISTKIHLFISVQNFFARNRAMQSVDCTFQKVSKLFLSIVVNTRD